VDFGYTGAISKSRNFSGWQKKYQKSENDTYWWNAKIALPHHCQTYKFSINPIAFRSLTFLFEA
jgi:hypothetical protein